MVLDAQREVKVVTLWVVSIAITFSLYLGIVRLAVRSIKNIVLRIIAAAVYGAVTALGIGAVGGDMAFPFPAVLILLGGNGSGLGSEVDLQNSISLIVSVVLLATVELGLSMCATREPK
jgi:hypothetical protein